MRNRELRSQIQSLSSLLDKVDQAFNDDLELQSHWAKYICILSAGLLENAIYEIYREYSVKTSGRPVANFATKTLAKIQNPNTNKILDTARSFDSSWADELELYLNEEGRKEAINSIITNRHKIAHGKSSDITLARIKGYLKKSIQVLEFIENQVGN
jgi:hypothetical protein